MSGKLRFYWILIGIAFASCRWGFEIDRPGDPAGDGDGGEGGAAAAGGEPSGDGDAGGGAAGEASLGGGAGAGACASEPEVRWYIDRDGDGFGLAGESQLACDQPAGFVDSSTDCADQPNLDPDCGGKGGAECSPGREGADECDFIDQDCDGFVDEDCEVTLPVTIGLILWLDGADSTTYSTGESVATWTDKSDQGNHAIQMAKSAQPTVALSALGGRNAVRFDGADDSLNVDNSDGEFDTANLTVFLVLVPGWLTPIGNNPSPFAIRGEFSSLTRISLHVDGSFQNMHSFNGVVSYFSDVSGAPFVPGVGYVLDYSWGGGTEAHFRNGVGLGVGAHAFGPSLSQGVRIGTAQAGLENFNGDLAEIIVFNRSLAPSERSSMEDYFETKWTVDTSP